MKINNIMKGIILAVSIITLAACSSTKGGAGGAGGGYGNGGAYGAGGQEAYGQGSGGSFYGGANCDAPQNADAYYFDFDSNAVHPEDRERLQAAARNALNSHSKVRVVGNTDNRGSREYNVALGWRRADAVSSALEQYGVSKQQVATTSNGAEKPVAYGNSEQDYQCNRRVDVKAGN
ncbi:MAG: putative peptidoglycan-associated lipoprotein [Gammaproteobacteria bacterium]|nr:putative peptidoglycan-associated lipoprotein [Gammaproteobacteria bacterium]